MAVGASLLTNGNSVTPGTSFVTASITPTANDLILLWVTSSDTQATSVTGCSLTWVQVATVGGVTIEPAACWRALGASPTSGAVTINFGATQAEVSWIIIDYSGVDTSGTNGSSAIVQSNTVETSSGTSATVTLSSGIGAGNAVAAAIGHRTNENQNPGSGYSELGEQAGAAPIGDWAHEWRTDGTTTPSMSWTTSDQAKGIAVEIKTVSLDPNQYMPLSPQWFIQQGLWAPWNGSGSDIIPAPPGVWVPGVESQYGGYF